MYNGYHFGAGGVIVTIIVFLIALAVGIFFLLTLQKALNRCSPENRTTSPASVWLLLIPLFNLVWQFIIVLRISESLHNEFTKRGMTEDPNPGKTIGLAYCILVVCSFIPFLGIITSIAALVCGIIYWVKISGYSNKLVQPAMA